MLASLLILAASASARIEGSRLRTHGRFEYSPICHRYPGAWGSSEQSPRLAVYIAVNLEHFAFGEGYGGELVPTGGLGKLGAGPDVLNWAWREYGNRVGAYRLLELLDAFELPCSVLVNSELAAHAPELVQAHVARGDEIVAHGATNSQRQGDMPAEVEAAMIADVRSKLEGPSGWLGPWISQSHQTPDLLQEAGFTYLLDWCHDDEPTYLRTRSGNPILSLPYPQEINDIVAVCVRRASAAEFADMIVDQLEEQIYAARHPDSPPLVMGIAIHPYIMGQPFRLRHLRRVLSHIAAKRDAGQICFATAGDIANVYRHIRPPDLFSPDNYRAPHDLPQRQGGEIQQQVFHTEQQPQEEFRR